MCWRRNRKQLDLAQDVCRLGAGLFGEESLGCVIHNLTEASPEPLLGVRELASQRTRSQMDGELASSESSSTEDALSHLHPHTAGRAWLSLQTPRTGPLWVTILTECCLSL